MNNSLHIRKSDKSDIKDISYPKGLEGLSKIYDDKRKEINLQVPERGCNFYQYGSDFIYAILLREGKVNRLYPKYEEVELTSTKSKVAKVYNVSMLQGMLDIIKNSYCSKKLLEFENLADKEQGERINDFRRLLNLYQYLIDNNMELVIH